MTELTAYEARRLLPRGSLLRGHGLRATLLAGLATVALVGLLVCIHLLAGLITTAGHARLTAGQAKTLSFALGEATPLSVGDGSVATRIENAGVVPQLVHPDSIGPGWLIDVCRLFPPLADNTAALGLLVLLAVAGAVVWRLGDLAARSEADAAGLESAASLRGAIHRHALRLNPGDLDGRGVADAESLFVAQVDQAASAIRTITLGFAREPVRIIALAGVLLALDWRLALLSLIPVAAGLCLLAWERDAGGRSQQLAESRAQRHLRSLSAALGKARLIRGYGMEDVEHAQFDRNLHRFNRSMSRSDRQWRWRQRFIWTLAISLISVVIYLVIHQALDQATSFTAADALLFLLTLGWLVAVVVRCQPLPAMGRQLASVGTQVNRYLDRIPAVSQAVGAKFIQPVATAVSYENVSYVTADGEQLLDKLELKLESGVSTALASLPSGARDETRAGRAARAAAFLLPRFLEPSEGRVLFDGEDIAWGTLESIREEACWVGGEPFFSGTVRENIDAGLGKDVQDVVEAAKTCHAHKFIVGLKDGYETRVGEHGTQVPPGPAFLIELARAALRDPAVLIVSEPAAELSEDIKALVDDAYNRLWPNRTVLVLPNRLSTIRRCDRMVLLADGKVAAVGPQAELVQQSDSYRHWEYVMFSRMGR